MHQAVHGRPGFGLRRRLAAQLIECLYDESIGLGKDRNVDRGHRLMVHAPAVRPNAIDRAVDDRFFRRML